MIAYKLVRKMKNGSLAPLFINKKLRLPIGEWLEAENHPTKGFQERMGWHCCFKPVAPHLTEKGRTWIQVEVEDFCKYNRPESQGGTWILANRMKVIGELPIYNKFLHGKDEKTGYPLCKHGHIKSPENVLNNNYCKECRTLSYKKHQASERYKEYQREYQHREKRSNYKKEYLKIYRLKQSQEGKS